MRTSYKQFAIMMEFMEKNGDLSKVVGGPKGRYWCMQKWAELSEKLNKECSGDPRPDEKWRKVWSDFKNNTKKKLQRITKASPTHSSVPRAGLTDLELRVMALSKKELLVTEEESGEEDDDMESSPLPIKVSKPLSDSSDLIGPGTSRCSTSTPPRYYIVQKDNSLNAFKPTESQNDPTPRASSPKSPTRTPSPTTYQSRRSRSRTNGFRSKANKHTRVFLEAVRRAEKVEIERERRSHEIERERIRQRDVELELQAQWLIFMKEALNVIKTFVDEKYGEKSGEE